MRKRIMISNLLTGVVLLFSKPESMVLFKIGLFFVVVGEFIRLLSSAAIRKNGILSKDGPYSLCRNPLYLGTFIIIFGILIQITSVSRLYLTLSLWILVVAATSFIYFYQIRSEERFLSERFGKEYEDYKTSVPCVIPRLSSLKGLLNTKSYSLENLLKNKEYRGLLGVLVIELILFLKLVYRV